MPDPEPPGLGAPEDDEPGLDADDAGEDLAAEEAGAGREAEGDAEALAAWAALCAPEAGLAAGLCLVLLPGMLSCFFI